MTKIVDVFILKYLELDIDFEICLCDTAPA